MYNSLIKCTYAKMVTSVLIFLPSSWFFCWVGIIPAVDMSVLLYCCSIWTLMNHLEKKLSRNYSRMLQAVLNKSWKQHTTKQQLKSYLLPILQTSQVRQTRDAKHCWRSKDEHISNILWWTTIHEHTSVNQLAKTCIHQLYVDTGGHLDDLTRVMANRDRWQETVKGSTPWW